MQEAASCKDKLTAHSLQQRARLGREETLTPNEGNRWLTFQYQGDGYAGVE